MYKRNAQGWSKHLDFILVDEIALQLAFLLAVLIRHHELPYTTPIYRALAVVLLLIDAVCLVLRNSMHGVMSRGYFIEAKETLKNSFYVFSLAAVFLFVTQTGIAYSRVVLFLAFVLHCVISYLLRIAWKQIIRKRGAKRENKSSMLVVASPDKADQILKKLSSDDLSGYKITGVVLTECTGTKSICGYPVVADLDHAAEYIVRMWIDSVYIEASLTDERVLRLLDACTEMAIPTHYHVPNMSRNGVKRFAEKIGGTTVLTTSINYATPLQLFIKRCFDIVAGLAGSIIALIIIAIVGPKIKRESPGPILFVQERIGKNGKRFIANMSQIIKKGLMFALYGNNTGQIGMFLT